MPEPIYLLVGGLIGMGFDPTGQFLLVLSHSGRGVYALPDWQRVARDPTEIDSTNGLLEGIGPLAGQEIRLVERTRHEDSVTLTSPDGRFRVLGEPDGITVTVLDR